MKKSFQSLKVSMATFIHKINEIEVMPFHFLVSTVVDAKG
jgi:hypothetical protein